MDTKQVILVRTDLGMGKGKIAAQVAHTSLNAFLESIDFPVWKNGDSTPYYYEGEVTAEGSHWINGIYKKIVLRVTSEKELIEYWRKAKEEGLPACLQQDIGLTQLDKPEYTALAIGPDQVERIDPLVKSLKLL